MRRRALVLGTVALLSCSSDHRPAGAPVSSCALLAANGVHEDVSPVSGSDGVPLPSDRPDDTTVHVSLPDALRAGESITVTMAYTLTVPGPTADRVAHDGDTMRLGSFLPLLAWE